MTNYRIDRIGTHRHASTRIDTHRTASARIDTHRHTQTRIGTDFDHIDTAKQGQGYKSIVSRYEYWANGNW